MFFVAVGEAAEAVDARCMSEVEQLFELFAGFAGIAAIMVVRMRPEDKRSCPKKVGPGNLCAAVCWYLHAEKIH